MRDDQPSVKAEMAAALEVAGTARARHQASKRLAASQLQRPSNFKSDVGELAALGAAAPAASSSSQPWYTRVLYFMHKAMKALSQVGEPGNG